ncbi:hypothetical protein QVD17_02597 [Tagetes erecta]|uniref:Protein kinase domain-containing protein n=1 Tax=Tagetes erecta TaxID=13708 RepID=A0AAD8L9J8_TARER|nr:hypothetical protein QVD17_02597 [Tagetes erecta]
MSFSKPYTSTSDSSASIPWSHQSRHFKFSEILTATRNFAKSLEIGSGGFGRVYIGNIINEEGVHVAVAIKRLNPNSKQGAKEFVAEVMTLPALHHSNIVSLIGFCEHEKEKILVYEYVSNGSIFDHLHKHRTPLSWLLRLHICLSVGQGLHYLHNCNGVEFSVIHGDFKSSNILLDGWVAKISDFGLSEKIQKNQEFTFVKTVIKGTFGCLDPNYCRTGKLRRKTDVYAFGVFLLEVLCRKRVLNEDLYGEGMNLVKWVRISLKNGKLRDVIDPDISAEISQECLEKYISIAQKCLDEDLGSRPTMAPVVVDLEKVLASQLNLNSSLQPTGSRKILGIIIQSFSIGRNSCISSPNLEEFRFDDLRKATNKFSLDSLLGEGSFGKVFLGWIDKITLALASSKQGDRVAVAVKKLKQINSPQGGVHARLQAEVDCLGKLKSPNIIRLLGYCIHKSETLLVYEYMPNKSLYHLLFPDAHDNAELFTWASRLITMLGVASGLECLHLAEFIHFNLRSRNILVPEDFNAKLGGLSLVKHYSGGEGSHGTSRHCTPMAYEDPECKRTGLVTMKSDIYCLGMVLLESLTGRHAFSFSENIRFMVEEVNSNSLNVKDIMDPRLKDNYPLEDASICFALALRCVADKPNDRPSIVQVLQILRTLKH